jgi:hypothetical protein
LSFQTGIPDPYAVRLGHFTAFIYQLANPSEDGRNHEVGNSG